MESRRKSDYKETERNIEKVTGSVWTGRYSIKAMEVLKMYRENCFDVLSVGVAVTSAALFVYFGDWIKDFVKLNLVAMLLLVHAVYVGIRVYVNDCKRARGYY